MFGVRTLAKVIGPLFALWFLCEFAIYYLVLWQCQYPTIRESSSTALRAMILADTHLLGTRQGHWFDKLRREWQMYRAFQTAQTYFRPELVVFLGDVFDEGKWCGPDEFATYVDRFHELFSVALGTEVRVVAGNHDMGFHYSVTPYLNQRFEEAFEVSAVERFTVKGVQFISINSMAMEGDGCFLCEDARKRLRSVAKELACLRDKSVCKVDYDLDLKEFSRPILLQHFPLFRTSDASCQEEDEAPDMEKTKPFKENWDCLSKNSTKFLLETLNPRLVLSGHTHHGCRVKHSEDVPEWSVSSFSWRNRNNPTFLLATFTANDFALEKCFLPEESTVQGMYLVGTVTYVVWLIRKKILNKRLRRC